MKLAFPHKARCSRRGAVPTQRTRLPKQAKACCVSARCPRSEPKELLPARTRSSCLRTRAISRLVCNFGAPAQDKPVALELKVLRCVLDIDDGATPLNGADGVPRARLGWTRGLPRTHWASHPWRFRCPSRREGANGGIANVANGAG